jgi:acetyltransferase
MRRAFVRDLCEEARYYRFMTRLSDLPEAMAERFTSIEYIGHLALVAEVFMDASATTIGEARYIVDPGDAAACVIGLPRIFLIWRRDHAALQLRRMRGDTIAANTAMISLAKRTGFAARNPEAGRRVRLSKDLPTGDPTNGSRRPFGGRTAAA